MPRLGRAALFLFTALAAPLAGLAPAQADPTVELTGFGDFSGARTQLVFDDLGLVTGDDVAGVGDAVLSLSSGVPAEYYEDNFARESGIEGVGSVSNFWQIARPYPDVDVRFASPKHRVGFEARVNTADQVAVSLVLGGVLVEQLVIPSRGSDMLYFYGFENTGGFDQVLVDVVANASGAFTLDNLTYESLSSDPDPGPGPDPDPDPDPAPDPDPEPEPGGSLVLSCDGFDSFPRAERGQHLLPVRALLASLADADGVPVTDAELATPPTLRVLFTPDAGGAALDVTHRVVWRSPEFSFLGRRVQRWFVWVLPWHMRGYGTYMATLESGDPTVYTVDPTCADWTLNPRPQAPHREKDCKDPRNHRHHRQLHERRGGR